jgi:hypothetical protein
MNKIPGLGVLEVAAAALAACTSRSFFILSLMRLRTEEKF